MTSGAVGAEPWRSSGRKSDARCEPSHYIYFLETVEVPLRIAVQEAVAIIDPSTDNGSCHRFCQLKIFVLKALKRVLHH